MAELEKIKMYIIQLSLFQMIKKFLFIIKQNLFLGQKQYRILQFLIGLRIFYLLNLLEQLEIMIEEKILQYLVLTQ